MDQPDYYAILQVDPGANQEQVRLAYKRLALEVHPDLSVHPEANRQMQLLNEAYAVLGNSERRAEYDRQRTLPLVETPERPAETGPQTAEAAPPAAPPAPSPPPGAGPAPLDPEQQKELERRWRIWVRRQLKILAGAILFTLVLFGWSLISGEFNLVILILLLVPVFVVIIMFLLRIRSFI